MISKPPVDENTILGAWLQEVYFEINRRVWTVFLPPSVTDTNHGRHPTNQLVAAESVFFEWIAPHSLAEVKSAVVRYIPTTTGTIDWTANAAFAGHNEDENANTATVTAGTVSVTDDEIEEANVTSLFASVGRSDSIGIQFTLDALATTVNIHVMGLYIRYFNA